MSAVRVYRVASCAVYTLNVLESVEPSVSRAKSHARGHANIMAVAICPAERCAIDFLAIAVVNVSSIVVIDALLFAGRFAQPKSFVKIAAQPS